jgi:hypothetical protein
MVSWRYVLSRVLSYMQGQRQGSSAGARAELCRRAHRAKQALTQSCAGTRAEPHPHARRANITSVRTESHASTREDMLLHEQ